jgi:hypothetical protein
MHAYGVLVSSDRIAGRNLFVVNLTDPALSIGQEVQIGIGDDALVARVDESLRDRVIGISYLYRQGSYLRTSSHSIITLEPVSPGVGDVVAWASANFIPSDEMLEGTEALE